MTRETLEAKAARLLADGRLTVLEVGPGLVRAECAGDRGLYRLGFWRGSWGCSCPAWAYGHRPCAHLHALRLVVLEPTRQPDTVLADAGRWSA